MLSGRTLVLDTLGDIERIRRRRNLSSLTEVIRTFSINASVRFELNRVENVTDEAAAAVAAMSSFTGHMQFPCHPIECTV